MPTIHYDNAQARVEGLTSAQRNDLRKLVSYRDQELPPVAAQHIIKSFMARKRRWGTEADLNRIWADLDTARKLDDIGWGPDRLTPQIFERTLRLQGAWDGWMPLVGSRGHFGAGLVSHVERALRLHMGLPVEVVDEREKPLPENMGKTPRPKLYPFQHEAMEAWFDAGCRGVVNLPPRSGKTHIAIGIVVRLGLPALIVVPTKQLVRQTAERFREYLHASEVVEVTGGAPSARLARRMAHALVWVATPPTAAGPKSDKKGHRRAGLDGIRTRKVLIIDEFHHAAADTWQDISYAAIGAYYRLGLTGTHYRADGKDLKMHAVLSRCVYRRTVAEMVERKRLVPARVAMVRVRGEVHAKGRDLYVEGVTESTYRNELISRAAQWLTHLDKRVLVLVKEIPHGRRLAELIPGAVFVDAAEGERVGERLEDLQHGRIQCLVGTSVIGEGVDVPAADALIYAAGGRSKVKVVQDYFRVLTVSPGKTHGIVIDCADLHHPKLEEAAVQRFALYRQEPAFTAEIIDAADMPTWIRSAV